MSRRGFFANRWSQVGLIAAGALAGYFWSRQDSARRGQAVYSRLARGEGEGPRVVVVGAGFAGISAATTLGEAVIRGQKLVPTLVDMRNYHLFTPLLYQVATGGVEPGHITYPMRFVARDSGFLFHEGELQGVDLESKRIRLDGGDMSYDYLILALGAVPNFFGMADVARNTLSLKWCGDAIAIRNRILDAFDRAESETDPARRRELLTFVVVGGGATGVELMGAIYDLIHGVLLRDYPTIAADDVRLVLIEGKGSLLPGIDPRMSETALRRLREQRVEVVLNTVVAGADEGSIRTRDGKTIDAQTIVWTAGVKAPALTEQIAAPRARDGRLQVNEYLQLPEHPEVYAVGDLASLIDPKTGRPLPANAPVALQEGRTAAENVLRRLRNEEPRRFVYRPIGDLVSLGRTRAVADLFGVVFDGFPAWLVRRTVYLVNLVGFKNRLDVLLDWAADFLYHPNVSRVEYARRPLQTEAREQARPRPLTKPEGQTAREGQAPGEERPAA